MRALYRRLPEDVRRVLRPLNLLDEAASFLPPGPRRALHAAAEAGRRLPRLRHTRYAIRRLTGPGAGGGQSLTVLLASDDLSARYWKRVLFAAPPTEEPLGEVGALGVRSAARRLSATADLSLWQIPWPLPVRGAGVRVPSWIPLWLGTDRSLDEVIAGERSGRAARKNEVRRVARLDLTARVVTDHQAYRWFREELYLPYVNWRFDDLAIAVSPHVFRHAQRHGCLLLLERDGRAVSGAVIDRAGRQATVLVFGVHPDGPVPAAAALEACYYHSIRFAVEEGFGRLSLGTCRPVLTDGVLRYKRKWGARLGTPTTWDSFALRYRNTPAVRAVLAAAPLIVEHGSGRLAALVGAPRDELATHLDSVDAPGLAELACLVDEDVEVPARPLGRHTRLRVVLPGEVWPVAARAEAAA